MLDIFHAGEHIWKAGKVLHGEGTAEAEAWVGRVRERLLADGWPGLCDALAADLCGGLSEAGRAALDELTGYFAVHTGRVGYFGRLQSGRSIGSGAVEGQAKQVGKRLKCTGPGWAERHVDPMAALVCAVQTTEWDALWDLAP